MQPEDITNKPYFFSNFRNTAEVSEFLKLKAKGAAGVFLVRPSFKNPQNLTVSVVVKDKTVRHTNIIVDNTQSCRTYYLVKEKQFCNLQDLLEYYRTNDVKNLEKVNHVRFLSPVLRPNRGSSQDDSSSNSSSTFHQPQSPVQLPTNRPPLPERPATLQRRLGSVSSQSSLLNASSSMQELSPMGYPMSPPNVFAAGFFQDSFSPSAPGTIEDRPPAPLPGGHKTGGLYYSTPRDVNEDISDRLKEVLKQNDRCDCGIPRDMADMPQGWTVHKSKDAGTYGRLFFQNVQGVTTWKIPLEVQQCMTVQQNYNIRTLTEMFSNQRQVSSGGMHTYLESPANSTGSDASDFRSNSGRRANIAVFNGQNPNISSTNF
ncbi:uncharacterized protein LOC117330458 [Pecten maximus]|uniref:uncharacterized protein LOC117330458 n=1 Tax=Pecten maximus TaxID=6579 RepID=UPI0014585047|nr:uncharacterized protein LOC117330458 [Pecten maximus]XP_033744645.1 uncharacterized protein LOC117330458 [Pecten maximus]